MVWETAHGVRGVVRSVPTRGKAADFLGSDHGGLWWPSRHHRQTGRPVENNALWALPLPPESDFPGLEAESASGYLLFRLIPTELVYGTTAGQLQMLLA
jgi:hypothetical protein